MRYTTNPENSSYWNLFNPFASVMPLGGSDNVRIPKAVNKVFVKGLGFDSTSVGMLTHALCSAGLIAAAIGAGRYIYNRRKGTSLMSDAKAEQAADMSYVGNAGLADEPEEEETPAADVEPVAPIGDAEDAEGVQEKTAAFHWPWEKKAPVAEDEGYIKETDYWPVIDGWPKSIFGINGRNMMAAAVPVTGLVLLATAAVKVGEKARQAEFKAAVDADYNKNKMMFNDIVKQRIRNMRGGLSDEDYNELQNKIEDVPEVTDSTPPADGQVKQASMRKSAFDPWNAIGGYTGAAAALAAIAAGLASYEYAKRTDPDNLKMKAYEKGLKEYARQKATYNPVVVKLDADPAVEHEIFQSLDKARAEQAPITPLTEAAKDAGSSVKSKVEADVEKHVPELASSDPDDEGIDPVKAVESATASDIRNEPEFDSRLNKPVSVTL